ncbi:MAG: PEPxxWA-CTERM sorting domain-containing protein [Sphingomonadales bacterium]|jgi:hypothetical protein
MKSKYLLAAAVIAGLAGSAAHAAVGTATFTGTLASLNDTAGLFPGAQVGSSFTAVWVLDTELGVHRVAPGLVHVIYGGSQYQPGHSAYDPANVGPEGYTTPVLSAALTINGVTVNFLGDTYGNGQSYFGSIAFVANSDHKVAPFSDNSYTQLLNFFDNGRSDLLTSFTVTNPVGTYGSFDISRPGTESHGIFNTMSMSWQVPPIGGTVPEPASWAMMLCGFGLTGAALRRQRRPVTA